MVPYKFHGKLYFCKESSHHQIHTYEDQLEVLQYAEVSSVCPTETRKSYVNM